MDLSKPAFLQGTYSFSGSGFDAPVAIEQASYQVPGDKRGQLLYFRAGNSADALVSLIIERDGKPMRYFPLGAKSAMHVPLAVVEDLPPECHITLAVAAPPQTEGWLVVDIGFVEI